MSSGDLEKSLRDDIENYVQSRLGGLQEEVARLQSQLNEAFTRLQERVEATGQTDPSITVAIAEHLRHARNEGVETAAEGSARARASSDVALIKAAVDDLGVQRTQADILDALVNRAASFAPRVAFFVVKNERATGWRARGLEGTVGDDSVREISLPLSADTLLGKVAQARSTWSGTPGTHAEDNSIYGRFGDEPPQRIVAVPLVARDKSVAVLYADSAGLDADAVNLEAIEALVRVAGMAVELLAAKRPSAAEAKPSAEHAAAADAEPPPAAVTQPRPEEPQPEPDPRFAQEAPPAPVSAEPEAFSSEDAGPQAAAPAEVWHEAAPPPQAIEPHVAADAATAPSPTGVEPYTPHAESFAPPPAERSTAAPEATPLASLPPRAATARWTWTSPSKSPTRTSASTTRRAASPACSSPRSNSTTSRRCATGATPETSTTACAKTSTARARCTTSACGPRSPGATTTSTTSWSPRSPRATPPSSAKATPARASTPDR